MGIDEFHSNHASIFADSRVKQQAVLGSMLSVKQRTIDAILAKDGAAALGTIVVPHFPDRMLSENKRAGR